jgi:hypothetical protein
MNLNRWLGAAALVGLMVLSGCAGSTTSSAKSSSTTVAPGKTTQQGGTAPVDRDAAPPGK